MFRERGRVYRERERDREMESVCREREGVSFEIERGCVERKIEVEIECVQNDRNVFMSRDRESVCVCVCVYVCVSKERHKRTATG